MTATENVLSRVVSFREALEVGEVDLAYRIAADLEDDLAAEITHRNRFPCGLCGADFQWPGLLELHHDSGQCLAVLEPA